MKTQKKKIQKEKNVGVTKISRDSMALVDDFFERDNYFLKSKYC